MMKSLSQIKKALRLNLVADLPLEDTPAVTSEFSSFVQPNGRPARGKGAKAEGVKGVKSSAGPDDGADAQHGQLKCTERSMQ